MKNTDSHLFIDDFFIKGSLQMITIRSPVSKGRLLHIDAPKMPGVYTLITASDIPGTNCLQNLPVPVLADEKLSYIGEPIALLVGPDISKLEEYAAEFVIHTGDELDLPDQRKEPTSRAIEKGNTEHAFKHAGTIIEGTYKTGIQEHWCSDPPGAIAYFSNNALMVHTSTQWPFHVKQSIAAVLGIKQDTVVVRPSLIGIHLDGKLWYPSLIACQAALAASIVRKAVKLTLTREEDFLYSPKRNAGEISIKSAVNKKGELLGAEIDVRNHAGSYEIFGDEALDRFCLGSLGSYIFENVKIDGHTVNEPLPPQGPFAGFGLSQGFFAIERHVSQIADTLQIDPIEWRQRNILLRNNNLLLGVPIKENLSLDQLLGTAASMSDYHRKWASYELLRTNRRNNPGQDKHEPLRGIGVSLAYQGSGFIHTHMERNTSSVELTMDKDSTLEIKTSMVSSNDENTYLWKATAAEILSLDIDAIHVTMNSTDIVPDSGPSCLSRNITIVTRLIERACSAIRKQRFRDPLPITVKRSYTPSRVPGWDGTLIDQNALTHLSWAAAVVEIEVDPVEFIPVVRGIWFAVDGGKILSEQRARLSLGFSIIHALGWASLEKLDYINGKIPQESTTQYNMPAVRDVPPIKIDFLWNDSVSPKGIGELPFSTIPSAYAQAITQAVDYPFNTLPVTAEDVWQALSEKNKEQP